MNLKNTWPKSFCDTAQSTKDRQELANLASVEAGTFAECLLVTNDISSETTFHKTYTNGRGQANPDLPNINQMGCLPVGCWTFRSSLSQQQTNSLACLGRHRNPGSSASSLRWVTSQSAHTGRGLSPEIKNFFFFFGNWSFKLVKFTGDRESLS